MKTQYTNNSGTAFTADSMLPCPFCGGEPDMKFIGNDFTKKRKVTIKCKSCRVERTVGAIYKDQIWCAVISIEEWNKRFTNPSQENNNGR